MRVSRIHTGPGESDLTNGNHHSNMYAFKKSFRAKRLIFMKPRFALLILSLSIVSSIQTQAATLPDACGNDKVKFDITLQKNSPAPAAPDPGKGQIIFVEASKKPPAIGCMGQCGNVARYGVDGVWVGATKDNSYFTLSLDPGEHHLCAVLGKEVDAEALTVEAGKVYYFEVNYNAEGTQYGTPDKPNYQIKKNVAFSLLKEDEGKYRVKASDLSTAVQKK